MLSVAEKEKLLNWDTVVASEEALQHREQVEFIVQQFRRRNKSLSFFLLPPFISHPDASGSTTAMQNQIREAGV